MASVTKGGEYWRAQVRRLGFPPQSKTFDTNAEAEAWARATESEVDRGIFVPRAEAERTTLAEAQERYKTAISSRKAHPAQGYRRITHGLRQPPAHRCLTNLKGADFAQYRDLRRELGRAENTIRLELALVSHFPLPTSAAQISLTWIPRRVRWQASSACSYGRRGSAPPALQPPGWAQAAPMPWPRPQMCFQAWAAVAPSPEEPFILRGSPTQTFPPR